MANFVSLSIGSEVLTLLNLKPAVITTTVGKDGSINAACKCGKKGKCG